MLAFFLFRKLLPCRKTKQRKFCEIVWQIRGFRIRKKHVMSSYFIVVEEIFHAKSQDCDEKWHYVRPEGVPLETGVIPTISQVPCISGSLCDRSESVPDMCAKCIEPPNCCQIRKLNQICQSLNRKNMIRIIATQLKVS